METLLALDRQVFNFVTSFPPVQLLNDIAIFLSGVGTWGIVWVAIAVFLFFREEKRDHWFFVSTVFVLIGGLLSEFLVKNLIARPRPTDLISTYSFPSSHALLAFAFAFVLSHEEPKLARWLYTLALLIALSRVYLGVHYPLDILAGSILGIIVGWLSLMLGNYAQRKLIRKSPSQSKKIQ